MGNYFAQGCHPNLTQQSIVVTSVEKKCCEHLENLGLGFPLTNNIFVEDIVTEIVKHQGKFVEGTTLNHELVADDILKMILQTTNVICVSNLAMLLAENLELKRIIGEQTILLASINTK